MSEQGLRARVSTRLGPLAIEAELDTGPGTLVVVGPNGAGKSSLLSLLLGVLPVTRGRIEVTGTVLLDTEAGVDVPVEHRRLAWVPQDYALFPHLTVRGNVELAITSATRGADPDRATQALRDLDLLALADRRPQGLSGGEKQRLALARALSVQPRALLLDEPLAALDVHARRDVRAFLADKLAALALPTVVVTHDAADARALGARIAVLEGGKIVQAGRWEELEKAPSSRFVEELVST